MKRITVGLIGNPNSGKTTLFNALTGSHQRVGNWPGVTVEQKVGEFLVDDCQVKIIDLPGIYSLSVFSEKSAIDERIAAEYLLNEDPHVIINVVDANNLERNLYLTTQLLELEIPVVVALNMTDIAKRRGIIIDTEELSSLLNCPIISLESNKRKGIAALKQAVLSSFSDKTTLWAINYSKDIHEALERLIHQIKQQKTTHSHDARFLALRLLENDKLALQKNSESTIRLAQEIQKEILEKTNEDSDTLIADARYQLIHNIIHSVIQSQTFFHRNITSIIDRIVLNRLLGIPVFLSIMYLMFLFAISIGGAFQDFFNMGSDAVFVHGISQLLLRLHVSQWIVILLSEGIGKGINTTLTFIPVIGAMFLFLSFLESSGYMARAAFIVDRFMCAIGLPGKSFVPMIVGFGCNVPAILSARTLDNPRDRILTIMMTPFMSCGAKFAIYTIFIAAFFPKGGQNIVFILYLIGVVMAIFTGLVLRKTLLYGEQSSLVLEMPPYHIPSLINLLEYTWHKLKSFIYKAGKIIVPVCLILGLLNSVNLNFTLARSSDHQNSILSTLGKKITPVLSPLGIQQDNWPATVGLIAGVMAKEVVIATLNTLYMPSVNSDNSQARYSISQELYQSVISIPENFKQLWRNLGNPFSKTLMNPSVKNIIYGKMYQKFDGKIGAFAYLLFILLYFPCIATTAAMLKELNWRWTLFSLCWTTGIAYAVSVLFYQLAHLLKHPISSLSWALAIFIIFSVAILCLKKLAVYRRES